MNYVKRERNKIAHNPLIMAKRAKFGNKRPAERIVDAETLKKRKYSGISRAFRRKSEIVRCKYRGDHEI